MSDITETRTKTVLESLSLLDFGRSVHAW